MKEIRKILACIDLSDYSAMTLECALSLSKGHKAQIIVFNVINQRDIAGVEVVSVDFPMNIDLDRYAEDLKHERNEKLKLFIKNHFLKEKSKMVIRVEQGVPWECILKQIETEAIDLVVIGNKGRGNLARVLFGSTAEKVFRHSQVPVVSVRNKDSFKREW